MASLCEGGNEPPGTLKAVKHQHSAVYYIAVEASPASYYSVVANRYPLYSGLLSSLRAPLPVLPGTLASQYFVSGDIVLGIQGYSAKDLLHVEAIELVRDPGKSLELLVQKCDVPLDNQNNELPASIWGPESVLQRPSEWLRRSPSPFARNLIDPKPPEVGYRSLNTLKQHFESVNQNSTQPDQIIRTGYTPTALDSKLKQQFELNEQTGYEQTMGVTQPISEIKQVQMVNQVSSVTQHMSCGSPPSQGSQFDRHVYHEEKNKYISYNIQETNQSSEEVQENIGTTLEYQQNTSQKSSNTTIVEQKTSNQTCTAIQKNTAITNVSNRIENVTEKQRIPSTADILKRPISPEFNMFPNSKGGSLLKLVLSKSLGNYSPHDFEKMRATETYEESDDGDDEDEDEDSETSEEEEEDEDEEATEEEDGGDNDCESQEEYIRYMSCDSDVALSSPGGSVVFDRYWMAENDDGALSDDSELAQQCPRSPSLSRNSSRASAASPYPDDRG
ncbi:hypothetical protein ANN_11512 [Periplaneta americana]|uniref:PDZ domain-containing protein n=1 Tax=Periplaneta americana TaxID=6978 RepID=A0ABQ8T579_PERAM|nr:hypothetical protein ANN_11512 [Periplaneta americana]